VTRGVRHVRVDDLADPECSELTASAKGSATPPHRRLAARQDRAPCAHLKTGRIDAAKQRSASVTVGAVPPRP
jgi:hypothetical protein